MGRSKRRRVYWGFFFFFIYKQQQQQQHTIYTYTYTLHLLGLRAMRVSLVCARYTLKRFKVKSGLSKLAVTFIEFMATNFELSTGSALEISQNRDTARHSDWVRFFSNQPHSHMVVHGGATLQNRWNDAETTVSTHDWKHGADRIAHGRNPPFRGIAPPSRHHAWTANTAMAAPVPRRRGMVHGVARAFWRRPHPAMAAAGITKGRL